MSARQYRYFCPRCGTLNTHQSATGERRLVMAVHCLECDTRHSARRVVWVNSPRLSSAATSIPAELQGEEGRNNE